jgi:multidrug efflux pump subunit AcrB
MNLPEFSVRNSVFGNMITVAVFAAGLFAAFTMTRELFPVTEMDIVVVRTVYRNASASEIEKQITCALEEEIRGIDGIDEFTSISAEGISVIGITLDPDEKNKDRIITDISRKMDRVKDLPSGAEKPDIEVIASKEDVIHVTVSGDVSEDRIREVADRLKKGIEGIGGVGFVAKVGWRDPEVWVEVDPRLTIENEVALLDIVSAIAAHNVNMPGGTMSRGDKDLVLRTIGEFETTKDIESVIIHSNPDGNQLKVADVAVVTDTYSDDSIVVRADGSRAVILDVRKKHSGDAIRIAEAVKTFVKTEQEELTDGVKLGLLDFESYVIKRRLRVLLSNGIMGLVLVLCFLPFVLNFRVAIWTALGIPFAFLAALLVMSIAGITINMMTMFGIILVVGMLVDDAIIVAENVFRHLEMGKTSKQAAIDGSREVMWPVTATIMTTIAAFLPLLFLPGIMGKILKWIPMVVIITLLASLFEALIVLPCHLSEFVSHEAIHARKKRRRGLWDKLHDGYVSVLRKVLRHKVWFAVITLLVFVVSLVGAKGMMRVEMFPSDLIEIFVVNITAPEGSTRDTTEERAAAVEVRLTELVAEDELKNMITYVGQLTDMHGAFQTFGSRYSSMFVYLTPEDARERKASEIISALREEFANFEGLERLQFEMVKGGPPVGREIDIKIVGEDYEVLDNIADEMKAHLVGLNDVTNAQDDYEWDKDERRIIVDHEEAGRLGVTVADIAGAVYAAYEGAPATVIRDADEETIVRVRFAAPYHDMDEYLDSLRIRNRTGRLIELSRVARIENARGVNQMYHYNGDRAISVTAGIEGGQMNKGGSKIANDSIWAAFKDIGKRFPGTRIARTGEWEEAEIIKKAMGKAGLTALLLIYTILVMQFRSFLQPFVVLVSIPFGLIGVLLALFLHGKPISIMAMLGMVGMCGVVVNDAIVLVSFINNLRGQGMPINDAIIEAGRTRFRPIILTSVTTVLGMAPVIYGIGGYEPFVAPAAIVLAYGLVFATVLTLLIVPCMYSLGANFKGWVGALSVRPARD